MEQGVIAHSDQSLHQSLHSNYNLQVIFIDYYCMFKIFFLNLNIFCAWKLRSTPKNPSSLRIGRLLLLSWWCRESPFILSLCHRVVSALPSLSMISCDEKTSAVLPISLYCYHTRAPHFSKMLEHQKVSWTYKNNHWISLANCNLKVKVEECNWLMY